MARKVKITSISETQAAKFNTSESKRKVLPCTKITGFFLLKLAKGSAWRWRYTNDMGKRKVVTIGNYPRIKPEEAARKVVEWQAVGFDPLKDKADKKSLSQESERLKRQRTLRAYLDGRFAKLLEKRPLDSAKQTKGRITKHFADLLDRPMDDINKADIHEWQTRVEKHLKYDTIKRVYTDLKSLLRQAVRDEVIEQDPLDKFRLDPPTLQQQQQRKEDPNREKRRMLTQDEVKALMNGLEQYNERMREHRGIQISDAYSNWFIPFCLMAFHTGLRPGDIYTLQWGEELNIPFKKLKKGTSKSSRALRANGNQTVVEMELNHIILEVMTKWWKQQGKPISGYVFPSPITGLPMDKKAHTKPWAHVKRLGKLSDDLQFYALRHNFVSALVSQGIPLLAVAKLAGHKTTLMIEQHYGHLSPKQETEAINILAESVSFETKAGAL